MNLTVPLASDAATAYPVAIDAGRAVSIGDRVDGRRSLLIYNAADDPIDGTANTTVLWIGFDSNVAVGNGFPVAPGGTFTVSTRRPVWGAVDADLTVYTVAELDRIDPCDLPGGR